MLPPPEDHSLQNIVLLIVAALALAAYTWHRTTGAAHQKTA